MLYISEVNGDMCSVTDTDDFVTEVVSIEHAITLYKKGIAIYGVYNLDGNYSVEPLNININNYKRALSKKDIVKDKMSDSKLRVDVDSNGMIRSFFSYDGSYILDGNLVSKKLELRNCILLLDLEKSKVQSVKRWYGSDFALIITNIGKHVNLAYSLYKQNSDYIRFVEPLSFYNKVFKDKLEMETAEHKFIKVIDGHFADRTLMGSTQAVVKSPKYVSLMKPIERYTLGYHKISSKDYTKALNVLRLLIQMLQYDTKVNYDRLRVVYNDLNLFTNIADNLKRCIRFLFVCNMLEDKYKCIYKDFYDYSYNSVMKIARNGNLFALDNYSDRDIMLFCASSQEFADKLFNQFVLDESLISRTSLGSSSVYNECIRLFSQHKIDSAERYGSVIDEYFGRFVPDFAYCCSHLGSTPKDAYPLNAYLFYRDNRSFLEYKNFFHPTINKLNILLGEFYSFAMQESNVSPSLFSATKFICCCTTGYYKPIDELGINRYKIFIKLSFGKKMTKSDLHRVDFTFEARSIIAGKKYVYKAEEAKFEKQSGGYEYGYVIKRYEVMS